MTAHIAINIIVLAMVLFAIIAWALWVAYESAAIESEHISNNILLNDQWHETTAKLNNDWAQYHEAALIRWEAYTNELIAKAANEAAAERDKAWSEWRDKHLPAGPKKPKSKSN